MIDLAGQLFVGVAQFAVLFSNRLERNRQLVGSIFRFGCLFSDRFIRDRRLDACYALWRYFAMTFSS